ncbi:hypothetical protein [Salinicoccus sp. Marseille-QA3877]
MKIVNIINDEVAVERRNEAERLIKWVIFDVEGIRFTGNRHENEIEKSLKIRVRITL